MAGPLPSAHHHHCPLYIPSTPDPFLPDLTIEDLVERIRQQWPPEKRDSCQCDDLWAWEHGVAEAIGATANEDGEVTGNPLNDPGVVAAEAAKPWEGTMKHYVMTIRLLVKAVDDIEARAEVKRMRQAFGFKMGCSVKLQELYHDKPPRKIPLTPQPPSTGD